MSQYGFRLQAAQEASKQQSEADALRLDELRTEVSERITGLQVFSSEGWPYVSGRIASDVEEAERLILAGVLEDDPKRSAYVRGQVAAYRFLLNFEQELRKEIDERQEEIDDMA